MAELEKAAYKKMKLTRNPEDGSWPECKYCQAELKRVYYKCLENACDAYFCNSDACQFFGTSFHPHPVAHVVLNGVRGDVQGIEFPSVCHDCKEPIHFEIYNCDECFAFQLCKDCAEKGRGQNHEHEISHLLMQESSTPFLFTGSALINTINQRKQMVPYEITWISGAVLSSFIVEEVASEAPQTGQQQTVNFIAKRVRRNESYHRAMKLTDKTKK